MQGLGLEKEDKTSTTQHEFIRLSFKLAKGTKIESYMILSNCHKSKYYIYNLMEIKRLVHKGCRVSPYRLTFILWLFLMINIV